MKCPHLIEFTCTSFIGFLSFHRIDQTLKLYYGGAQKRPEGQYSRPVYGKDGYVIGQVSEASKKDIRNAVEGAVKAAARFVLAVFLSCESQKLRFLCKILFRIIPL